VFLYCLILQKAGQRLFLRYIYANKTNDQSYMFERLFDFTYYLIHTYRVIVEYVKKGHQETCKLYEVSAEHPEKPDNPSYILSKQKIAKGYKYTFFVSKTNNSVTLDDKTPDANQIEGAIDNLIKILADTAKKHQEKNIQNYQELQFDAFFAEFSGTNTQVLSETEKNSR